jgi:hypothetical protein
MKHRNRFGDADLADRSGPEYAWMDRVVAKSEANGTPLGRRRLGRQRLDRQQLDRLMADLEDVIVDKLRRGYRVNLGPVMLYPDGTVEALEKKA